ncbi:hypothetical protein AURDEDRAFT_152983 [Auricularia subglabra TFB-10046 SS5]|nr:hypothetical protein AURDEDRAFT_152983 [Auricularia subglabra TFB-10046 SS5]
MLPEQDVILQIRRNNGVDAELSAQAQAHPAVWETMQNLKLKLAQSLQVLCAELYSKPAHFVLEVIQNADDNTYAPDTEPELRIVLRHSHMEIQCNEVGFSDENVRAFCGIGQSTKKNQSGYIGEKGIGAKSIFQVARKVFVQSRGYSFVLDRDEELGMISPHWTELAVLPGWTRMTLEFCDEKQYYIVKAQLEHVRMTVLLFMRRLAHLHIDDGTVFAASRKIDGDVVTITVPGAPSWNFLRVSQIVPAYPYEPKRAHCVSTEVSLAFPLDQAGQPWISWQLVYAFLPLRAAGFTFIIQADFLTAANREDVLWDLEWNINLRSAISKVFLSAVEKFKRLPALELTWPRYLPANIHDPFFAPAAHEILASLRNSPIVKCEDGKYRHSPLVRCSSWFVSPTGEALVAAQYLPFSYAAPYPEDVKPHLRSLGVEDMTFKDFLDGLLAMGEPRLTSIGNEWLEQVCSLINLYGTTWNAKDQRWDCVDQRVRQLPLVHLHTGRWARINSGRSLFFGDAQEIPLPSGLGISLVQTPTSSPHRTQLLERLGVRKVEVGAVVDKILELHRMSSKMSVQEMLEHALYVYERRLEVPNKRLNALWLPDADGNPMHGGSLYMDPPQGIRLRDVLPAPARFLHENFLLPVFRLEASKTTPEAWPEWLQTTLGVSTSLRVVGGGKPAPEVAALVQRLRRDDPALLLRILRESWPGIQAQLTYSGASALYEYFAGLQIRCQFDIMAEMRATSLPVALLSLPANVAVDFPQLPISEMDDGWTFLRHFGVSVELDAKFFLKSLISLSQTRGERPTTAEVRAIYKQLEARFPEIPKEIRFVLLTMSFQRDASWADSQCREAFNRHSLFYVNSQWLSMTDVVWDGPHILTLKTRLKATYSNLDELFQKQLCIKDASPVVIADELRQFSRLHRTLVLTPKTHERLIQLLEYAASTVELIKKGACADWTLDMQKLQMLPVRKPGSSAVSLFSCKDNFFVPDASGHLEAIFLPHLTFLSITPMQAVVLRPLLQHLNLEEKRIDNCVSETVMVDGAAVDSSNRVFLGKRDSHESSFYRARLRFFQRLQYYRASKVPLTRAIRAFTANKLEITYAVKTHDPVTITKPLECWVSAHDGELRLFNLTSLTLARRRGTTAAEALTKALGLADTDISITAAILRYDPDETDILLRKSGIRELDVRILELENLVPQEPEPEDESEELELGFKLPVRRPKTPERPALSIPLPPSSGNGNSQSRIIVSGLPTPATPRTPGRNGNHSVVEHSSPPKPLRKTTSSSTLVELDIATFLESEEGKAELNHLQRFASQVTLPGVPRRSNGVPVMPPQPGASPMLPLAMLSSSPSAKTVDIDASPVGFLGEKFVFDLLKTSLPDFTYENWTSELRAYAGYPGLCGDSPSDFVYDDRQGILTRQLFPEWPTSSRSRPRAASRARSST